MVTRCFSGFKIAGFNDICFAAFALASGCSSSTAVHARAAVTKPKPKPNNTKDGLESETRRQLHAYIRDICKPLENEPTVRNKNTHTRVQLQQGGDPNSLEHVRGVQGRTEAEGVGKQIFVREGVALTHRDLAAARHRP